MQFDDTSLFVSIFNSILAGFMALLGLFFKREVKRLDDIEDEVSKLQKEAVTREDITDVETRINATIKHGNDDIKKMISEHTSRIDNLYGRGGG